MPRSVTNCKPRERCVAVSASQTQSSHLVPSDAVTTARVVSKPTGCAPAPDGGLVTVFVVTVFVVTAAVADVADGDDPGDVAVAPTVSSGTAPWSPPFDEPGDDEHAATRSTAANVHRTLRRLRGVGDDVASGHDL